MSVAAILGAGDLGGALAYTLAVRDRFREIRLIDSAGPVAAGKALDIRQSGPVLGFGTRVVAADAETAAAGARLVIAADPAGPPRGDHREASLDVIRRARAANPRAPLVCAGADGAWLVERGVAELRIGRALIVGSAPAALAAAVAALLGLEAGVTARHVELLLVGRPPDRVVIGWEEASISGRAPASVLPPHVLARIGRRVPGLWPPGVHALASAAARVAEAFLAGDRRQETCFVALDGEAGEPGCVSALPVRFAVDGLTPIRLPPMSPAEHAALENALATR